MFQALRIPDFRLLWGGGLISSLGSWLLVIAIPAIAGIEPVSATVAGFGVVDGATSSSIASSSTGDSPIGVTGSTTHPQRPSSEPTSNLSACLVLATARTRRSSSPHLIDSDRLC